MAIEVRGVRELQRAFGQVERALPKELRAEFLGIAQRVVAAIQPRIPSISGRAASSLTPKASNRGASIAFGGRKAEYYPWLDFGGSVGRNRSIHRPLVVGGRYLYPGIAEHRQQTAEAADEAIEKVAERAGFETRGSA